MGTIPNGWSVGGAAARGGALEPSELRHRLDVARCLDAILGEFLEFARSFLVQGGVGDLPANAGMREQAFHYGRGLRHTILMPATIPCHFEKYQFCRNSGRPRRQR